MQIQIPTEGVLSLELLPKYQPHLQSKHLMEQQQNMTLTQLTNNKGLSWLNDVLHKPKYHVSCNGLKCSHQYQGAQLTNVNPPCHTTPFDSASTNATKAQGIIASLIHQRMPAGHLRKEVDEEMAPPLKPRRSRRNQLLPSSSQGHTGGGLLAQGPELAHGISTTAGLHLKTTDSTSSAQTMGSSTTGQLR